MPNGWFISIEGGEGAGKTSVIRHLEQELTAKGYPVMVTREPGGIEIAEKIRSIILDKSHTAMDARTEALLYAAARRQHLAQKVIPALQAGAVVICDRFIDSSLAYQGYARGLGIDEVYSINRFATSDRMPDLTLWLDVSPETGLSRIHADQGREINRLDLEGLTFHHKVREGYRVVAERFAGRIVRIDADRTPEAVWSEVRKIVELKLEAGKDPRDV
ncbi:dTMP kinase [Gorillibacterium sp. sgz5001074]|uniref:dTMP kinase n=1 Tax=Gorillibacterium sp. sgz5001074 TaxID=3446695 RepID=UPI003F66145B